MSTKRLGYLGTGIMGSGMVENLLAAGFEVHVYNRTQSKLKSLLDAGAKLAPSPADLASTVDVILSCVTNDQVLEQLYFSEQGITAAENLPKLVIDFSTISPSRACEIAATLQEKNISFLDAPVSGGDVGAKNGTLTVMVGGEEKDFNDASDIFSAVAKAYTLTGPVGSGQKTKCVNQIVCALTVAAMTEGLVFAKEAGLDLEKTISILSGGAAGSWSLDNYGPRIVQDDLAPGFYARDMLKDLRIVLNEADSLETSLPIAHLVKELYQALCAGGDGELGNHGLLRLYERFKK